MVPNDSADYTLKILLPSSTPENVFYRGLNQTPKSERGPMSTTTIPARLIPESRALTAAQFQGLAEVPPELEWFANIPNEKTRRAYQRDLTDFSAFIGIHHPEEFRR